MANNSLKISPQRSKVKQLILLSSFVFASYVRAGSPGEESKLPTSGCAGDMGLIFTGEPTRQEIFELASFPWKNSVPGHHRRIPQVFRLTGVALSGSPYCKAAYVNCFIGSINGIDLSGRSAAQDIAIQVYQNPNPQNVMLERDRIHSVLSLLSASGVRTRTIGTVNEPHNLPNVFSPLYWVLKPQLSFDTGIVSKYSDRVINPTISNQKNLSEEETRQIVDQIHLISQKLKTLKIHSQNPIEFLYDLNEGVVYLDGIPNLFVSENPESAALDFSLYL